jgi:hypothetical protein
MHTRKIEFMSEIHYPLGFLRKRVVGLAFVAHLSLFGGAILLMAVPLVRASEINEHESPRERVEDPTLTRRIDHDRHLHLEYGVVAFLQPAWPCLGHAQRQVLTPLSGHRLTNGLLAPITC